MSFNYDSSAAVAAQRKHDATLPLPIEGVLFRGKGDHPDRLFFVEVFRAGTMWIEKENGRMADISDVTTQSVMIKYDMKTMALLRLPKEHACLEALSILGKYAPTFTWEVVQPYQPAQEADDDAN